MHASTSPVGAAYPDLLGAIQGQLGRVYDVDLQHDVRDYVVTDREMRAALMAGSPGRLADEQLIVVESDDGVDLALYLDSAVLQRLVAADPRDNLSGTNLADFWTVLEGVSHFHYLAWNAAFDKPVTLLELEMQAEVDKYVSTRLLLHEQPAASLGAPLLQRLFEDPGLDPQLDPEEMKRYQAASSLAGRYCSNLESRFPVAPFTPELLRELRTFYRLPQTAKIARIRACGFA